MKVAAKIKSTTKDKVKSAQEKVNQVAKTLDDTLMNHKQLAKVRKQLLEKKKKLEKESELATQLALQVLQRAKKMRQKLERKSKNKNTSITEEH